MHTTHAGVVSSRHGAWLACLWLFLVLMGTCVTPGTLRAAAAPVAPVSRHASPAAVSALPLAAWYDGWMTKLWNRIESQLNNRTGAIQFGLIGMLIALWIIWWRK
jgi:hypothetical protein